MIYGTTHKLGTKAAETFGVLTFLVHVAHDRQHMLPDACKQLKEAGESMLSMLRVFDNGRNTLSDAEQDMAWQHYTRFLSLTSGHELPLPKRHVGLHLLKEIQWFGNPVLYMTWLDESLNKDLKGSCRMVSQATFEKTVLTNFNELLKSRIHPNKRKRTTPA